MTNTGSLLNTVTNSGTLSINDGGTAGDLTNMAAGLLNFNGTGTIDSVNNAGTFNFAGAGQTGSITNSGTANISGTGTTGAITNSGTANISGAANVASVGNTGTVNLTTTAATIGTVTNAGTWNIASAGGNVGIAGFTQTSTGNLVMAGNQKFNINGPAALGGTLTINDAPTAFGRYTMMSGSPVTGSFATLALTPDIAPIGYYLKQVGNDVKLYITPSFIATQNSITSVSAGIKDINGKVISNVAGILGNDCAVPGLMGGCISIGYSNGNVSNGDLQSGNLTVSKALNQNIRVGISLGQSLKQPSNSNASYKQDMPVTGGFIGYTSPLANGASLDLMASIASQTGSYTINRPLYFFGEAGSGTTKTSTTAYQLKTTYTMPVDATTTVSPYIAIRRSQLDVAGYTEMGPIFPLIFDPFSVGSTDLAAGIGASKKLNDKLTASVGVGVTQNVSNDAGRLRGISEIYNLSTFEQQITGGKTISANVGAGLSYEITAGQKIGASVGWSDQTILKPASTSFGISYTLGF
jgi:hypothetical protein